MKQTKFEKIVPDTSVIIEAIISSNQIVANEILIHEAVLAELEHQANEGRSVGFLGLEEIEKIRKMDSKITYVGQRPKYSELKYGKMGEVDSIIRNLAYEEGATLLTADNVQARVAKAKGIDVHYVLPKTKSKKIKLEKFFDELTMSVHLKENVIPVAKKGKPGEWDFVELAKKPITHEEIKQIQREIIEEAKARQDGFLEIEREGSTIVQLSNFRIVIARPPFADGWEITAVRPVKRLVLDDYKLSEKLFKRVAEQAEGVLIAGAPGMGKSTFAQSLAEFYSLQHKIVKTVEAPRDLVLPDSITQYAISHGDAQEIHDILLLSRPDYTFFDEMRNTDDFKLFADMRLSGVGMVGVVHGTNPVDSIQRFIGRIEMGVIPQIIDTVIFIKNGVINKVLSLEMTVKVPSGMTEADLARPIVVINDFETNKLEYEIYTYGEQTVVVPVKEGSSGESPSNKLAAKQIEKELHRYVDEVKAEVVSANKCIIYVPSKDVPKIIGKQGKNIMELEKKIGISIDVQEMKREKSDKMSSFDYDLKKNNLVIFVDEENADANIDIYVNGDYLLTAKASKDAKIKLKRNKICDILIEAIEHNEKVELYVK